jgi:hypothetical protein
MCLSILQAIRYEKDKLFCMNIGDILGDKSKKVKERTTSISTSLLNGLLTQKELIAFANKANEREQATCIEAIEYATKVNPQIVDETIFLWLTKMLTSPAPRAKWESARVIGNIAYLYPHKIKPIVKNLLVNAENDGTVVRWATAFALTEIIKLKTKLNDELVPTLEIICNIETDKTIKKKYIDAFKKLKNNEFTK